MTLVALISPLREIRPLLWFVKAKDLESKSKQIISKRRAGGGRTANHVARDASKPVGIAILYLLT